MDMSVEDYTKYKQYSNRLFEFGADQQLFYIVIKNYDEFTSTMNHYNDGYQKNPNMNCFRVSEMALNINRIVLNFLSSVRAFLDHVDDG